MKDTARIISIHSADTAGVCSMLYELGGMVVVHDASGCNSTYSTHDEPRWQHIPSHIFISALTETDAILGNDQRFVDDVVNTAKELSPRFIAICGAPIPMMIGTDFDALAVEIEGASGIPTLAMHTTGIKSYLEGAGEALLAICRRFCQDAVQPPAKGGKPKVNILGATPLDLPRSDAMSHLQRWLEENGLQLHSPLTLGGSLEAVAKAGEAEVNLVVSTAGLPTAHYLRQRYGTPYVCGLPVGIGFARELAGLLHQVTAGQVALNNQGGVNAPQLLQPATCVHEFTQPMVVVGEAVTAASVAAAWGYDHHTAAIAAVPLEFPPELQLANSTAIAGEAQASALFATAGAVCADPMYRPIVPTDTPFYALPSYAFSGRCYRKHFPQLFAVPLNLDSALRDFTTSPEN